MALDPAWLRSVAAHRDDDAWCSVHADRIAEDDAELATFVQLQLEARRRGLDRAERDAMDAIRTRRQADWLAPIWSCLRGDALRFDRGLLEACNVHLRGRAHVREVRDAVAWCTVRQIAGRRHLPALLQGTAFDALTTLGTAFLPGPDDTRVAPAWGMALACDTLHGIRLPPGCTGLQVDLGSETLIQAFTNCFGQATLAGLREAAITCHGQVSRRAIEDFPPTLERLSLDVPEAEIGTWVRLAWRVFPDLRVVDVRVGDQVTALRRSNGWAGLP